ncbi:hypothetical protein L916_04176, partial [Phytophthora nicotianae]
TPEERINQRRHSQPQCSQYAAALDRLHAPVQDNAEDSESETGLGLTKRETEQRDSLTEKLERVCPEFQRMKTLFGRRANIAPSSTIELF